jgi:hypothetical protein
MRLNIFSYSSRPRRLSIAHVAMALLAAVACGHPSQKGGGSKSDGSCVAGSELCACLAGNACDDGLVCGSGFCVRLLGTGGSGGSSGDDGAVVTGDGGSSGSTGSGGSGAGGSGNPGGNLVTNGDFSMGDMFWTEILNNGGNMNHSVQNGAWCVTVAMGQSVTLGWAADASSPLQLASGTGYKFSFRASASNPINGFNAKVGHAVDPFGTDFEQDNIQVGNGLQSFMYTFMPPNADDNTGIAFILSGPNNGTSDVCVDDVTLTLGN